jgi:uncharacterized protein
MKMENSNSRLHVVDALRGFAIVSILLLHNIEHFDVYIFPTDLPAWMLALDKHIWDTLFFLFGGKSYAIFALLFGLTFFIQSNNQAKKGKAFDGRFAWRMLLLFGFGMFNSLFFQGDIISFYAVLGLLLIPLSKFNEKVILAIAIFLLLQPLELYHLFAALGNPDQVIADPISWTYFGKMEQYISTGSFIQTIKGNITNGKYAVILWNWENGRFFHIVSLFLFGLLAGRRGLFSYNEYNMKFWQKTLIISAIVFVPFYVVKTYAGDWISSAEILRPFNVIEHSWTSMSFMLVLVSGFYLLFHAQSFHKILNVFSPIGKMSLSNYVFQSILGSIIYYDFGLGLYRYTGATYGVLIGLVMMLLFGFACTWWAKRYSHGPLEWLWHKATWI